MRITGEPETVQQTVSKGQNVITYIDLNEKRRIIRLFWLILMLQLMGGGLLVAVS